MIDKNKWYSLIEISDNNLFEPLAKDIRTCRKLVISDIKNKNILKTMIVGRGRQTRYHIQGKNIINFLTKIEKGYRL